MEQSQGLRVLPLTEKPYTGSFSQISRYTSITSSIVEHTISCTSWVSRFLPILPLAMLGYAFYAYCYVYCWKEVIDIHSRRLGVTFIITFCVFVGLVGFTWSQIIISGPGSVVRLPQYDLGKPHSPPLINLEAAPGQAMSPGDEETLYGSSFPPRVFACDSHGYPLWCSACQSVKLDRTHHSVELGRCVPKMDHFCIWIGSLIGLSNYKPFIQFVLYFILFLIFVIVSLAKFAFPFYRTQVDRAYSVHLIALLTLAGAWLIILSLFLLSHVRYILANTTTIEQLKMNRNDFPIFNFQAPDGLRVVSRVRHGDPMPYDLGRFENWKLTMGPTIIHWLLPIKAYNRSCGSRNPLVKSQDYGNLFNPKLLEILETRYINGEEGYLAYPHLQTAHDNSNNFNFVSQRESSTLRPVISRQFSINKNDVEKDSPDFFSSGVARPVFPNHPL